MKEYGKYIVIAVVIVVAFAFTKFGGMSLILGPKTSIAFWLMVLGGVGLLFTALSPGDPTKGVAVFRAAIIEVFSLKGVRVVLVPAIIFVVGLYGYRWAVETHMSQVPTDIKMTELALVKVVALAATVIWVIFAIGSAIGTIEVDVKTLKGALVALVAMWALYQFGNWYSRNPEKLETMVEQLGTGIGTSTTKAVDAAGKAAGEVRSATKRVTSNVAPNPSETTDGVIEKVTTSTTDLSWEKPPAKGYGVIVDPKGDPIWVYDLNSNRVQVNPGEHFPHPTAYKGFSHRSVSGRPVEVRITWIRK